MNFALNIQGSPYTSNSLWSALHFAQACLNEGHRIHRVFFYHDAVLVANALQAPPQDEMNLTTAWQTLGQNFELDLCLCVASCLRRGILNDSEAQRFEKTASNLSPGFNISGLGQLIEASLVSDRVISFGA